MRHARRHLLTVLVALLVLSEPSYAQSGGGSLTGLVKDESGAAVPGATISATSLTTNVAYTATSNAVGNYAITNIPVGAYVVKAELSGFKTATTKALDIEAKQTARLDFNIPIEKADDAGR